MFFCVPLTILSPVSALLSLPRLALHDVSPLIIVPLALICFSAFVGINVLMVTKRAITWLQAYFIISGGTALFGIGYTVALFLSADEEASGVELARTILPYIRILAWVVIWAVYFHKSKRVKATFGRNI